MNIDFELKIKLFAEYLNNGGIEKIFFKDLLEDLIKVKKLPNGKTDPKTVSSLVRSAMNAYLGGQLMEPYMSDKHMAEYETLTQKSLFFEQKTIETKEEFDEIYKEYKAKKDILFRGLSEAKYRLYSSLQRNWITNKMFDTHKSYKEFLQNLIENAKKSQKGVLKKYLEITRFDPENDLAILSFLQHYGCPTPLLDWTYSFENALYFATENIAEPQTGWEIEKYFCVYYLEEEFLDQSSLKEIVETQLVENREVFEKNMFDNLKSRNMTDEQIKSYFPKERVEELFIAIHGRGAIQYVTKVERLLNFPMLYFSDFKSDFKLHYFLNNNMNIVNQRGAFTWNSNPTRPLEHVTNEEYKKDNDADNYRFSKCMNINKGLVDYVKEKLESEGITKEFIYPDSYNIAKSAFEQTKNASC